MAPHSPCCKRLNNADKHRRLPVCFTAVQQGAIRPTVPGGDIGRKATVAVNRGPLRRGSIVAEVELDPPLMTHIDIDAPLTFSPAIDHGNLPDGREISPIEWVYDFTRAEIDRLLGVILSRL